MITKAYIEEVISNYKYRVRIPLFDQVSSSSTCTPTKLLPIASLCGVPGVHYNYRVGDIVYVAVENNERDNIVILGMLMTEESARRHQCDLIVNDIIVESSATLPNDTSIGTVSNVVAEFDNIKDSRVTKILRISLPDEPEPNDSLEN